jgi:hypothetical protein
VTCSPVASSAAPVSRSEPTPPAAPALPADLGSQLARVRSALLARVVAQLEQQGRPVSLRDAAALLGVVDEVARRHQPIPVDPDERIAAVEAMLTDIAGQPIRDAPKRRKRRQA